MIKRMSITLDEDLVKDVQKLSGARTKREGNRDRAPGLRTGKARREPYPARGLRGRGLGP